MAENMKTEIVSLRMSPMLKERLAEAATRHRRTLSEQMTITLEDGMFVQSLVAAISDMMEYEAIVTDFTVEDPKPSIGECLRFINQCVYSEIRQRRSTADSYERNMERMRERLEEIHNGADPEEEPTE